MNFKNPNETYWAENNKLEKRVIFHCASLMKPFVKGKIIDMGAGVGTLTDFFTQNNTDVTSVTTVDFSEIHKEQLESKKYDFLKIDLDNPSYTTLKSSDYNTVLSTDVVEHLLSPYAYLSECFRILDKEGYLIISTPDAKREDITIPHINFFSDSSFRKYLMRAGFKKHNITRVYNGIISPSLTKAITKIPLLRNYFSYGLYYICKK